MKYVKIRACISPNRETWEPFKWGELSCEQVHRVLASRALDKHTVQDYILQSITHMLHPLHWSWWETTAPSFDNHFFPRPVFLNPKSPYADERELTGARKNRKITMLCFFLFGTLNIMCINKLLVILPWKYIFNNAFKTIYSALYLITETVQNDINSFSKCVAIFHQPERKVLY